MKQLTFSRLPAFVWRVAPILVLLGGPSIVHAQTIITFDVANSTDTFARAINSAGQVLGGYRTVDGTSHGFLRRPDGTIITFDVPEAATGFGQGTLPAAIDPKGRIIGSYTTQAAGCNGECLTYHGFLRQRDDTLITFDVPGAGSGNGQGTILEAINPSGEITGFYWDANYNTHDFLRDPDGTIVTFDVVANAQFTDARINAEGVITGFAGQPNREHGYVRLQDGTVSTFDVCTAASAQSLNCNPLPNGLGVTQPVGINSAGLITGSFESFDGGSLFSHSFLRQPDGTIITFDPNGSSNGSSPTGINSAGEIIGFYSDVTNNVAHTHGFLREPDGTIVTLDIPGGDTHPSGINSAGQITGYYQDTAGHFHGFLLTPPGM
jgi:hypothetical protein